MSLQQDETHYPLKPSEWLQMCNALKPAELKILLYLRTLDPWGSRDLSIMVADIAEELNLNKRTVSRAVMKLDREGWINIEIHEFSLKGKTCTHLHPSFAHDKYQRNEKPCQGQESEGQGDAEQVTAPSPDIPQMRSGDRICSTPAAAIPVAGNVAPEQPTYHDPARQLFEPLHPWQVSRKANDFDKGFCEWVRSVYLPRTPHYEAKDVSLGDAKRWITRRQFDGESGLASLLICWEDYQESLNNPSEVVKQALEKGQDYDWGNDPRCDAWIEEINQLGPLRFSQNTAGAKTSSVIDPERASFHEWYCKNFGECDE
jgi:predicted DNA-binding transcriptional regulator